MFRPSCKKISFCLDTVQKALRYIIFHIPNVVVYTCPKPGLLVPVSVFSFLWITLLEEQSELRAPLCGLLVTSRYVVVIIYCATLFYSFIFRTFLVLYSDRGLILQGKPNLKLFAQLFWLTMVSFVAFEHGIFPVSNIIRGKWI